MPQDFTNEKSTLVQVLAWCYQATSHNKPVLLSRHIVSLGHNKLITHPISVSTYIVISKFGRCLCTGLKLGELKRFISIAFFCYYMNMGQEKNINIGPQEMRTFKFEYSE